MPEVKERWEEIVEEEYHKYMRIKTGQPRCEFCEHFGHYGNSNSYYCRPCKQGTGKRMEKTNFLSVSSRRIGYLVNDMIRREEWKRQHEIYMANWRRERGYGS